MKYRIHYFLTLIHKLPSMKTPLEFIDYYLKEIHNKNYLNRELIECIRIYDEKHKV